MKMFFIIIHFFQGAPGRRRCERARAQRPPLEKSAMTSHEERAEGSDDVRKVAA